MRTVGNATKVGNGVNKHHNNKKERPRRTQRSRKETYERAWRAHFMYISTTRYPLSTARAKCPSGEAAAGCSSLAPRPPCRHDPLVAQTRTRKAFAPFIPVSLHIAPACSCAPPPCNLHPSGRFSRILEDLQTALGISNRCAPPCCLLLARLLHRRSSPNQKQALYSAQPEIATQ